MKPESWVTVPVLLMLLTTHILPDTFPPRALASEPRSPHPPRCLFATLDVCSCKHWASLLGLFCPFFPFLFPCLWRIITAEVEPWGISFSRPVGTRQNLLSKMSARVWWSFRSGEAFWKCQQGRRPKRAGIGGGQTRRHATVFPSLYPPSVVT